MYIPKQFEIEDTEEVLSFIKKNLFGQLISEQEGRMVASHIPFLVSEDGERLICHIAKRNEQWKEIENREILITFQGEHDYVSPSWFESTGVPTWNYQVVHVYGSARVIHDEKRVKEIISKQTNLMESSFESPWPVEFNDSLLDLIVAIEIEINEIQCKFKASQNRPVKDRLRIAKEHGDRGLKDLSELTSKGCT